MEERLAQITHDFAENRDLYYRKHLSILHADMEYISQCNPYDDKPLEEFQGYNAEEAVASAAGSTNGSVRAGAGSFYTNGSMRLDPSYRPGKYALEYVKEINDALEQKDADLAAVAYRHNFTIDEISKDHELNVAVAFQEHQRLYESLKRRLTINLNQKKATLQKEKEKLDIADTNALLLNPNQFSVTNAASPGGPQSNRKTRHTRHRLEVEDIDAASNNKRKRKAAAEAENGSPAPAGRDPEPLTSLNEAAAKLEYQQFTTPLYSLDRLFSQRELDQNLQIATYDVIENFKRRKADSDPIIASLEDSALKSSDSEENDNLDSNLNADGHGDDMFLGAPVLMERTATNASQHATRSTRIPLPTNGISSGREGLGRIAGWAAGAALIGTYSSNTRDKKREEDYLRAPPLTEQEQEDDMLMYKAAMAEEDAGRVDGNLIDEVLEVREDFVGRGDEEEDMVGEEA